MDLSGGRGGLLPSKFSNPFPAKKIEQDCLLKGDWVEKQLMKRECGGDEPYVTRVGGTQTTI